MKWLKFWKREKALQTHGRTLAAILQEFKDKKPFPEDYASLAREAYKKNVIAYRAINGISQSVAGIPIVIQIKGKEVEADHPVAKTLDRPNPRESYEDFLKLAVIYRLISGNSLILGTQATSGKMELHSLRPDLVELRKSSSGIPTAYVYRPDGGSSFKYPIDPITLESEVLHLKEPNPLDEYWGLSPVSAAALGISQHNESSLWNQRLLKNSAKPSGIMVLEKPGDGAIPPDKKQLNELAKDFNEKYAGSENAGNIPFLNFDMKWQALGLSPRDMDWIDGKNTSARDVALAFGYPPHLLGMAEGSTFNNVKEAKLSLYQETVIPLLRSYLGGFSHFLSQRNDADIEVKADLDAVEALAPLREKILEESRKDVEAGIISINEARAMRNFEPKDNGDDLLVPAGKLPLGFGPSDLSDEEFKQWLFVNGLSQKHAEKIVQASR